MFLQESIFVQRPHLLDGTEEEEDVLLDSKQEDPTPPRSQLLDTYLISTSLKVVSIAHVF